MSAYEKESSCVYQVTCYNFGRKVRIVTYWDLEKAKQFVYINKGNYSKMVIKYVFI